MMDLPWQGWRSMPGSSSAITISTPAANIP